MADKQDNRSEQWLQDYARRRRKQQGSLPEMHDATRRLLHGEVQRTWGKTVPAEESSDGWESWLLKYTTGTVALGALAVGVWVSYDDGNRGTDRVDNTGSSMKITKAEPTQSSGERAVSEQRFPGNSEVKKAAITGRTETQSTARLNSSDLQPMAFSGSKDSPLKQDVYSNMRRDFSQQAQMKRSKKLLTPPKGATTKAELIVGAGRPAGLGVLQDFEVARNGNIVRVRDKDGSIYEGKVILASAIPLMGAIGGRSSNGGGGIGGSNQGGAGGRGNTPPLPVTEAKLPQIVATTKNSLNKSAGVSPLPRQPGNGLRPGPRPPAKSNRGTVYNDNIGKSLPLTINKAIYGHNLNATPELPLEDGYLNFHGRSVWYYIEINSGDFNGQSYGMVSIDTRGSDFDTTLGVFAAKNGNLGRPFNWDDNRPNASWSQVKIPLKALAPVGAGGNGGGGIGGAIGNPNSNKYFIAVDGVNGATGRIRLNVRMGTSDKEVKEAHRRLVAQNTNTHFYFQVAGTNRTSGQPVQFEGFMHNAPSGENKDSFRIEASREQRGGSATAAVPLRIQGRARYGGKRLTVDAFTASLTPTSTLKPKGQKK